jgi:8-oxo-dGTP pyrophosphatase MutT (NUDIX family)
MIKNSKSNFLRRRQRVNKHSREACAAGVLPLSTNPEGKRIALIGYGSCSQGGIYRNFWSDFGGKLDPEETAKEAALREFHEETAYYFKKEITQVDQLLKLHGNEKYVSFAAEVSYTPIELIKENAAKIRAEGTLYERNHIEMDDYRWIPLDVLLSHASVLHQEELYPPFIEYHLSQKSVQDLLRMLLTKCTTDLKAETFESKLFGKGFLSTY